MQNLIPYIIAKQHLSASEANAFIGLSSGVPKFLNTYSIKSLAKPLAEKNDKIEYLERNLSPTSSHSHPTPP